MKKQNEKNGQCLCADQLRLQVLNFINYNSHHVRALVQGIGASRFMFEFQGIV